MWDSSFLHFSLHFHATQFRTYTHTHRRRRRKKTVSYAWSISVGHFVCKTCIPDRVLVERHFSGGRFLDTRPMFVVIRFFHFSLRRVVWSVSKRVEGIEFRVVYDGEVQETSWPGARCTHGNVSAREQRDRPPLKPDIRFWTERISYVNSTVTTQFEELTRLVEPTVPCAVSSGRSKGKHRASRASSDKFVRRRS